MHRQRRRNARVSKELTYQPPTETHRALQTPTSHLPETYRDLQTPTSQHPAPQTPTTHTQRRQVRYRPLPAAHRNLHTPIDTYQPPSLGCGGTETYSDIPTPASHLPCRRPTSAALAQRRDLSLQTRRLLCARFLSRALSVSPEMGPSTGCTTGAAAIVSKSTCWLKRSEKRRIGDDMCAYVSSPSLACPCGPEGAASA